MGTKTFVILFILLQATTGGIYTSSGTYDIIDGEEFPIGSSIDSFGITVESGNATANYQLYRITFVWFRFTIHQLFNETGHEQENATVNAQLSPYEIREIGKDMSYSLYPNSTVYHTKGQTQHIFPVGFSLTDAGDNVSYCIVSAIWTLEWEYHEKPADNTLLILIIAGAVAAVVIPSAYCVYRRRKLRAMAKASQEKLRESRKKKKQEKEAKKVKRSGQNI
jgi:hypothetical protein